MTPLDFLAIGFNVAVGTIIAYAGLCALAELVKRITK